MAGASPEARSRSLRQTFLSFPTVNALTKPPGSFLRRGVRFLELPDELTLRIFELAITESRRSHCACDTVFDHDTLNALLLTCHRFCRIALPLHYRTIFFRYPKLLVLPQRAARLLRRDLQDPHALSPQCRVFHLLLDVYQSPAMPGGYLTAEESISRFKRVRCLQIYAFDCEQQIWACIQSAVDHMPEIRHLSIRGRFLDIASVQQNLDIPWLQKLTIEGLSDSRQGSGELQQRVLASSPKLGLECL
jgi:hypothetical protein